MRRDVMRCIFAAALIAAVSTSPSAAREGMPAWTAPAALVLAASPGSAKIPRASAKVPPEIASAAKAFVDECRSRDVDISPSDRLVARVDLNDDGNPDYIIDTAELNAPCFCGSGGCAIQAWVSDAGGYVKAFEANVRGWQLSAKDKLPPLLIVDLHGTACGGVGADLCLKALVYQDGQLIDTTAGR